MRNNAKTQVLSWIIPIVIILIGVYIMYWFIM